MPIQKIPIVHKFGIISHSQRLELQERLLKQSYLASLASHKAIHPTRNPYEVTEKFISDFNNADNFSEKEMMEAVAFKMLQRIKRRAGLKERGTGEHVDLPVAWTELSQLAQCKGKIQEECLDVLITSLDQSPLLKQHIPALFFLAETTLYWLRTDTVHQPYLRTGEIKLLRMGQLVFTRLFFNHMAGKLQGCEEFKSRLFTYLDGFSESQELYSPYPNALLSVRYMLEVGKIIIGDCSIDPGEIKEGDNPATFQQTNDSMTTQIFEDSVYSQHDDTHSSHSAAISSSVHDLSPTLWHSLDVWRCVYNLGGGLEDAVCALSKCGQGLAQESWVDGICAMHVLGDGAKGQMSVLRAIQNLARGLTPKSSQSIKTSCDIAVEKAQEKSAASNVSIVGTSSGSPSQQGSLSDILEKSEPYTSATKSRALKATINDLTDSSENGSHRKSAPSHQMSPRASCRMDSHKKSREMQEKTQMSARTILSTNIGTENDTAWRAEVGSDLGPNGRASQASSLATFTNAVNTDLPGMHGWHWEVAITYADIMADVCLHGSSSNIQKAALLGANKDINMLHKTAMIPKCPMASAGLLDLVFFSAADESVDSRKHDWSWRVRYAAMQGLVKICRCCAGDQTKEGMRTAAWTVLVKAHAQEKDLRVKEALKVGQVESNIENLVAEHMVSNPETVGAKVASGLSNLYLPPLPPPVQKTSPRRRQKSKVPEPAPTSTARKPLRTSLMDEILLATTLYEPPPTYNNRTTFDLKRVVEDQWRKELQKTLEDEEQEKQQEQEKKHKEQEQEIIQKEARKREKLKHKYTKSDKIPSDMSVVTENNKTQKLSSLTAEN